jgi:hypothetical protein
MIDAPPPSREAIAAQLWNWLPGIYRGRDQDGLLRNFIGLFADELWRLRQTVEQQYADHFIDSAQDWVIPYLADLVGTDVLFTGTAARMRETAARNREDVKNTLHWRRQKGTLPGLQGVAHDVGGFGVQAVEMFERLAWLQHLSHIKPAATFALDLRRGEALAATRTPFSQARALADLRPASLRSGWHRVSNVVAFNWPIESYPLADVTPAALGGGRYTFHPLGLDGALFAGGATDALRAAVAAKPGADGADICHVDADHVPIRQRDLGAHPAAYVDSPLGFAIREDGIALVGGEPDASPSLAPALDYPQLAQTRGMLPTDVGVYPAGLDCELAAVRLGAVQVPVGGAMTPVSYSSGQPFATQLRLFNPQGRLKLDSVTPDFTYTPGVMPYQPDSGEYHHPVLLLRLTNQSGAAANLPASEAIVHGNRGQALQVYLPAIASLAPGAEMHFYVSDDGSTYFARADHGPGDPDRNPDSALFGAYLPPHLARATEGQRRIRPGHPAGAARWRTVVSRPLCCWDRPLIPPLASGQVAIDPERGRLMFPAGETPVGDLTVDFRYGLGAPFGAGPYPRPDLPAALLTVAQRRDADHPSIQAAIDALPDGAAMPVVIEIMDSSVYRETLQIDSRNFPGGLVIQASALQTPFIVKPPPAARVFSVSNSTLAGLTLDGLAVSGGELRIGGTVPRIDLRHCSLDPASTTLAVNQAGGCDLGLDACLSGPIQINAAAGRCALQDSAVQHPAASVELPDAGNALDFANGHLDLERGTIVGNLAAQTAALSNTLCYGELSLADPGACCMRFSRLPRSYAAPAFRCTHATPIFVSLRWGDSGYLFLHPNSAAALLRGAEEGGEIGVGYGAGLPWRLQNASLRLAEYIPAGLTPVLVPVLPELRFLGNERP